MTKYNSLTGYSEASLPAPKKQSSRMKKLAGVGIMVSALLAGCSDPSNEDTSVSSEENKTELYAPLENDQESDISVIEEPETEASIARKIEEKKHTEMREFILKLGELERNQITKFEFYQAYPNKLQRRSIAEQILKENFNPFQTTVKFTYLHLKDIKEIGGLSDKEIREYIYEFMIDKDMEFIPLLLKFGITKEELRLITLKYLPSKESPFFTFGVFITNMDTYKQGGVTNEDIRKVIDNAGGIDLLKKLYPKGLYRQSFQPYDGENDGAPDYFYNYKMSVFQNLRDLGYNHELKDVIQPFLSGVLASNGCRDANCVKELHKKYYNPIGNYKLLQNVGFTHEELADAMNESITKDPIQLQQLLKDYNKKTLLSMGLNNDVILGAEKYIKTSSF